MAKSKVPLIGSPDFTNVNDNSLEIYVETIQSMIFAYRGHDKEIVKRLEEVWNDLSAERLERLSSEMTTPSHNGIPKRPKIHPVHKVISQLRK